MPEPTPGYITVAVERLPERVRTLSVSELASAANITRDTAKNFLTGQKCQTKKVRAICVTFGISLESLLSGVPQPTGEDELERVGEEWLLAEPLNDVMIATNDLRYRLYRLQHRHTPNRLGRGKKYDIDHLNPELREAWLPKLRRHAEVCSRVRHPRIPVHHSYFPVNRAETIWWVVDDWVPGKPLSEIVTTEDLSAKIPGYAWQLADGLAALHAVGIVRRDLSPDSIWVTDAGLLLTEFELAKLGQGAPTVSKHWPHNPYRAPEVNDGETEPSADVYSWAKLVTMLLLGDLPPASELKEAFGKSRVKNLPRDVRDLLISASAPRPSHRPRSFEAVTPVVAAWAKGFAS